MALLGLLFLLVVLAEPWSGHPAYQLSLEIAGYLLWAAFIAEFLLRLWLAPDRGRFLRSEWWRIPVLALPFLRFFAALRAFRVAALGRAIVSVVRGSTSAAQLLSERLVLLAAVTVLVILISAHMLYITGTIPEYAEALHRSALTTISGEPLGVGSGLAKVLDVVLATYSVIVFATLAGSIGAFFLSARGSGRGQDPGGPR